MASQLRQGLRLRRRGQRLPLRAAGPRRHRLHLGARPPPLPQARRGQRPRVRRRPLAPRAGRRRSALAQEALDGARLVASSTVRPAPPSGSVTAPVGLSTVGFGGAGGELGADEAEQGRAGHVGADRLRRGPGDPGQADEGLDRGDLVLDRAEDLLLAARAGEVVLLRVALVLAGAGERERLLAVDLLLAALQAQRVAAVLEAAVDLGDDAAAAVGDAAERVDQLREVLEVDLDEVVDLDAEVLLDGADRQRRAADGVGGVDLVLAVAGDRDDGVARDRERRVVAAADAQQQDRVRARALADLVSRPAPWSPSRGRRSRARGSCSAW